MKKNRKKITAVIVFVLIILIGVFVYKNMSIQKIQDDEYQDYTPQEEISDEQMRQTKVMLYFENIDNGELESEVRLVDANVLINDPAKELMNLLIKGPQSTSLKKLIPDGTSVHDVSVKNFCAEINLSNEFLNYGDEKNKLKIINSIVNTLTNLKEINSIKFLINGEQNQNLSEIYMKNKS